LRLGLQLISRERCQTAYLIIWLKSTSPIEKHHRRAIGERHPSIAPSGILLKTSA
jgi:hypothetical protein